MSDTEQDLSFVTTAEILDELSKRYDGYLFVATKPFDDNENSFECIWHGLATHAVGLAEFARVHILKDMFKTRGNEMEFDDDE